MSAATASALATARGWLLLALTVGLVASISVAEISLAALAVVVLLERRRPGSWPLAAPIAAFAGWTLLSAAFAARPLESFLAAKTLLTLLTLYVVLAALPDAASAHRFAGRLFAAMAALAAVAVVQSAACPSEPPALPVLNRLLRKCDRAHGFFSIYMTLAGVLTLGLVAALPGLLRGGRGMPWRGLGWLVGVAALAVTYTRGAWIGFAVGTVGCLAGVRRRALSALALAALAVAVAAMLLASPALLRRARSIGDVADDTTRERLAMMTAGVRLLRERPLTGIGIGQVKHYYDAYAPPQAVRRHTSHLHNTPLQIAVERGLPGLALWLWIWAAFFARMVSALRRAPPGGADHALLLGVGAGVAAFLVGGLFEYSFGDTEVLLVALVLMASALAVARDLGGPPARMPLA